MAKSGPTQNDTAKYFLAVASEDHVDKGVSQGFAQAGHGRRAYMDKVSKGDWIVYYSSRDKFDGGKPYQKFTAIGKITDENRINRTRKAILNPIGEMPAIKGQRKLT